MLDKALFRHRVTELLVGLLDEAGASAGMPRTSGAGTAAPRVWDVDSFSLVQLILILEDEFGISILATVDDFEGDTVDDFADFVAGRAAAAESETGTAPSPLTSLTRGDESRRAQR